VDILSGGVIMTDNSPSASRDGQDFFRYPIAFLSGFVAVLLFHQGVLSILHAVDFTPLAPFPVKPTQPFGLAQIWSLSFWGGVWGLVLAGVDRWFPGGAGYWVTALIFGAVFPSVVAWLVVFPIKGLPAGGGWHAAGLATGLMINGAWGLGTALFLQGLSNGWIPRRTRTVKGKE
jgi:hypothetical protein